MLLEILLVIKRSLCKIMFVLQSYPSELIEIAKLALAKGELVIAEQALKKVMHTAMFDYSYEKDPGSYLYLAEVLERKAENKKLELPRRNRFLLQAAALYNFVRNFLQSENVHVEMEVSNNMLKLVSRKLFDIQDNMVRMAGGNPLHCKFDSEQKRNELKNLRHEVKKSLESMESRRSSKKQESDLRLALKVETEEIAKLADMISLRMNQFLMGIIKECLEVLGTPPCDYEVIVLGSLARNEMTPYSDFEWGILTTSEEDECKVFFRNLTTLVHLQVSKLSFCTGFVNSGLNFVTLINLIVPIVECHYLKLETIVRFLFTNTRTS